MTDDLPQVTITADGAARGNPGPGGWAALLEAGGQRRLLSGQGPERTTNNAMELTAVAAALEALTRPCRVTLRLDSRYVLDGLERLRARWPLSLHDAFCDLLASVDPDPV